MLGQFSRVDIAAVLVCVLFLVITGYAVDWEAIELENRIECRNNLKGLGTAHIVYANDYEDMFVVQGGWGNTIWTTITSGWANPMKDWSGNNNLTVGASLYLLVREADVNPRSFVCPSSSQKVYDGANPMGLGLTELWDFGAVNYQDTGPKNCVSYSFHYPYNLRYAADGTKSAAFAVMADKSPWMDSEIRKGVASVGDWLTRVGYLGAYYSGAVEERQIKVANAQPHLREGQNVLFGDGHCSYEQTSDVGVQHDNIYTPRGEPSSVDGIRIGQVPEPYGIGYGSPVSSNDSFLVNDDENNPCFADQPGDVNGDCAVDTGDLAVLSKYWMESTRVED